MTEMPDIHSPEFRSVLFTHFMGIREEAINSKNLAEACQALTFDELTPAHWAHIVSLMSSVTATAEYVMENIKNLDIFVDDPDVMDKVKDHVLKSMEEEQDNG